MTDMEHSGFTPKQKKSKSSKIFGPHLIKFLLFFDFLQCVDINFFRLVGFRRIFEAISSDG